MCEHSPLSGPRAVALEAQREKMQFWSCKQCLKVISRGTGNSDLNIKKWGLEGGGREWCR